MDRMMEIYHGHSYVHIIPHKPGLIIKNIEAVIQDAYYFFDELDPNKRHGSNEIYKYIIIHLIDPNTNSPIPRQIFSRG